MNKNSKILITGGTGLVGSSIVRNLLKKKYNNIFYPSKKEMNLLHRKKVASYIKKIKPDYIFASGAYVGGIEANMMNPINFNPSFLHSSKKCHLFFCKFMNSSI